MNIYDIAKEAGVSITTVSRVINNKNNISKKTKERVKFVLDKYNYTPNAMARGLVVNSMKSIGIVTIDIRDPHYAATAYTIEQEFTKFGYNSVLCNTGGNTNEGIRYIKMLSEKKVDGIILIGSIFNNNDIKYSIMSYASDIPIVLVNGSLDISNCHSVLVDDSYGIFLGVKFLFEKGHRKIVYVKDADTYSAREKVDGFIKAAKKFNLQLDNNSIVKVTRGLKGGMKAIDKFMESGKDFSAILFGEDITAIGAMKELQNSGRNIPVDTAVIGFNNSIYAKCCFPELTSVDNKVETAASLSAKLLNDLIEKKNVPPSIMISPELVVRKSS